MTQPLLGDIRLSNPERDRGKRPEEITDFEIWDGTRWVHATEADKIQYMAKTSS